MKKYLIVLIVLLFGSASKGLGQIGVIADKAYVLDTLRAHSYSAGLSFLFYISDNEMDAHASYRFLNSAHFTYLFSKTDIELSLRQSIGRGDDSEWSTTQLIMLSSGIYKYRPINPTDVVLRKLYPELLFIYQDNSDRGLKRRFQLGVLVHPWALFRPKFNVNVGVGIVYDWSSWEVNEQGEIDGSAPELQEKIRFINSHMRLRKNMYQDHSEWRPMLLLVVNYKMNQTVSFNLNTSYQQSLTSPYSREIRSVYPDLGKVYPYVLTQFNIRVKLYKGLAMDLSATVDYENSNMSLYKSSWAYTTLIGVSWIFSNQGVR